LEAPAAIASAAHEMLLLEEFEERGCQVGVGFRRLDFIG
jgi:hypothetical protein